MGVGAGGGAGLIDGQGRRLSYLRLSITDRCDLDCSYCRAGAVRKPLGPPLTIEEIVTLGTAFADRLGFRKVRLTGGEPLMRRDLEEIIRGLRDRAGFERVALTTNGRTLRERVRALRAAGLDQVNVSLDTLCAGSYRQIRGADALDDVLAGIDEALAAGFRRVKVNVVLLRSFGLAEFDSFVEWGRGRPLEVRFIELMPTPGNLEFHRREHVSGAPLVERLVSSGFERVPPGSDDGPASVYRRPGESLRVGFLTPVSKPFCSTCNRLRVTATGTLKLCLFGGDSVDLRPHVGAGPDAVADVVRKAAALRPAGDRSDAGTIACDHDLSTVGG